MASGQYWAENQAQGQLDKNFMEFYLVLTGGCQNGT